MTSIIKKKIIPAVSTTAGVIFSLYIRIFFFPILTQDPIVFVIPWYNVIAKQGFVQAFSHKFYDYNPLYLYLLGLFTYLPWIPSLTAIKLISVVFDFVAAAAAYKIVSFKKGDPLWGWLAFFSVLLAPTVFIESGLWGQCDIIYTAFLLWMIYFFLRENYLKALFCFSIAFVFKSQAAFLAPLILLLFIRRKLKISDLWIPVLIYILSILPAFIAGRPLLDLLTIYFSQISVYRNLSMNAPNLFYPFSGANNYSVLGVVLGLVAALLFTGFYLLVRFKKPVRSARSGYLFDACFLTFFLPFFLPEMHERYFFPTALFLILVCFFDKKAIWIALLAQISSILSYIYFLFNISVNLTEIAFFINIVLAVWIFIWYWKRLSQESETKASMLQPGLPGN